MKPAEERFRQEICLNGFWQFQPVALPGNFREGQTAPPELPPVDPGRWEKTPLRVPSPWNVNSFADRNGEGGDFRCFPSYPKEWETIKMGWLRKTFHVPADWRGRRIFLHFDGVAGKTDIFVNGRRAGEHFDIFLPFELDVTTLIRFGEENELLAGVRKPSLFDRRGEYGRRTYQGGSFWGQHIAGIWQDVFLTAQPELRVADVQIIPDVEAAELRVELTIANHGAAEARVQVSGDVFHWIARSEPAPSSRLDQHSSLTLPAVSAVIPGGSETRVTLSGRTGGRLESWRPNDPKLYGLVADVSREGRAVDAKYVRFGWRQFTFRGRELLLNGQPIILRGDSWHFMGIPQMTRRYAWAWFSALHDAGLNAVRLHAQPYPAFYLDVADEMGIMVLDETAIWASDGGPKLDDPEFWQNTESHLAALVRRDRNHPSVFGWSVSNEIIPIIKGVMRNPPGMLEELTRHYGVWAGICRKLDPTRPWISADGEDDGQGKLPVYVVHYGGTAALARAEQSGKPWGVGEAGNAYYATPAQAAETNGPRAYESFEGRMEGVAISSYENLVAQREHHAIYRSVFNLAWYGLKPLPLGKRDLSTPPSLAEGVFFGNFVEGRPGVQPERLGPYCTTFNPGYDSSLPAYEPWPLFEAIRDAAAEPPVRGKWSAPPKTAVSISDSKIDPVASIRVLSGAGGTLADRLRNLGVAIDRLPLGLPQLLFIDGANPPGITARELIGAVLGSQGTVFVWGVDPATLPALNLLLPAALEISKRDASSLLPASSAPLLSGLTPEKLYFSELRPPLITQTGLAGPLMENSRALLKACDTDWLLWNKQPEYAKTAMVFRSELESKPSGVVFAEVRAGRGRLLITTLPAVYRQVRQEAVARTLLANLGLTLGPGMDSGKAFLRTGVLVRAMACGFFPASPPASSSAPIEPATAGHPWKSVFDESGVFDLTRLGLSGSPQNAAAFLSFWLYSPRSLEDLLLEPDLPAVNLEISQSDSAEVWLNGSSIIQTNRTGPIESGKAVAKSLKLRQGWNRFLIRVAHSRGPWNFTASLSCNRPEFLTQMDSATAKP